MAQPDLDQGVIRVNRINQIARSKKSSNPNHEQNRGYSTELFHKASIVRKEK
jgi:hypothetical protein